jgi:hypothetical protein
MIANEELCNVEWSCILHDKIPKSSRCKRKLSQKTNKEGDYFSTMQQRSKPSLGLVRLGQSRTGIQSNRAGKIRAGSKMVHVKMDVRLR